tara:strand:- start:467 stop:694 length:228 start_codon:yes stop_codon:yes gene_type:complete
MENVRFKMGKSTTHPFQDDKKTKNRKHPGYPQTRARYDNSFVAYKNGKKYRDISPQPRSQESQARRLSAKLRSEN